MLRAIYVLLLSMMIAAGCSSSSTTEILDEADRVAVYLIGEESQISTNDLEKHPGVLVVDNFADFQTAVSGGRTQLWVDKTAVDLVDEGWLRSKPQVYYPLVLVGYNNELYSFRENLRRFAMSGPIVLDWDTVDLEPGFSVQVPLQDGYEPNPFTPCLMMGYDQIPTVQGILDIVRTVEETKDAVLRMQQ